MGVRMRSRERARLPSVVEVAARAGVSVSTAARVLRGSPYPVSDECSARVRQAAAELGYAPNVLARSFRSGYQASVGLIVGDMLDPYFGTISEAVTVRATNAALVALVCNTQRDPALEIELCQRLLAYRVAGLILASGGSSQPPLRQAFADTVARLTEAGIVVLALAPRGPAVPSIGVDNGEVGELIGRRLLQAGHRQVGVIAGPADNLTQQERLRGLRSALGEAGVQPVVVHLEFSVAAGAAGVDRLLAKEAGLTAVVGGSDAVAFGAVQRLGERGLRVPGDVSAVGIGHTTLASLATPPLATVDVRLAEAANAAVDLIVARLQGGQNVELPAFKPRFVEGQSLGPPRTRERLPA